MEPISRPNQTKPMLRMGLVFHGSPRQKAPIFARFHPEHLNPRVSAMCAPFHFFGGFHHHKGAPLAKGLFLKALQRSQKVACGVVADLFLPGSNHHGDQTLWPKGMMFRLCGCHDLGFHFANPSGIAVFQGPSGKLTIAMNLGQAIIKAG